MKPFANGTRAREFVRNHGAELAAALLAAAVLGRHVTFVPIWDGRTYFESLRAAVRSPFDPLNFNVFGHPTMLFMLWSGLGQFIDPGNAVLLNLSQIVLAVLGVWAFGGLLRALLPLPADAAERFLAVCTFAVFPVVLGAEQNFNPDTGVMVFLLLYLRFLLERRYALAVLAGFLLVSSKESGVVLYPLATAVFAFAWWRDAATPRPRPVTILKRTFGFAPMLFWGLTTFLAWRRGRSVVWKSPIAAENQHMLRRMLVPDLHDLTRLAYGAGIWIINFHWLLTVVILVAAVMVLVKRSRVRTLIVEGVAPGPAAALVACCLGASIALTRFSTFANLRYLLPVYPLVLAVFFLSARVVVRGRTARLGLLASVLVLFAISVFRTLDPVSRAVYGTFDFGRHPILKMTSLTGECCGYGRDQLVYNLEYVHLTTIQDRIYGAIRPTMKTAIVKDGLEEWHFDGFLDPSTFRRTLREGETIRPRYMITSNVLESKNPPSELYYIAYPNVDNGPGFQRLRSRYTVVSERDFAEAGYSIRVTRMVERRPAGDRSGAGSR